MRAISMDLRQRIVEAYQRKEGSMRALAQRFKVAKNTVFFLIKKYRETGNIAPKPVGGCPPTQTTHQNMQIVKELLTEDNDATLSELCQRLQERTGKPISISSMHRLIKKLGWTWKKKTTHATEQETPEVKEARDNYKLWFWSVLVENLVFIDETGLQLNMTRSHARSKKGTRAKGSQPKKRGKSVTMIGAMALRGVLTSVLMSGGGTDNQAFLCFIKQFLLPVLWVGAIVVMDNLNVHHNKAVQELIESMGAKVVFLPTYSPEFNPIELLWSKLKAFIRKHEPRTREELEEVVAQALDTVSLEDILSWFIEAETRVILD